MKKRSAQGVKDLAGARRSPSSDIAAVSSSVPHTVEVQALEHRISLLEADLALYRSALENSRGEMQAFAYSVSHDLRAPLRAIEGFSKILMEDFSSEIGPDAQRFLKNIVSNTETLNSQIEDLLRFYRLGKNPPTRITSNADSLCREAIASLPPGCEKHVHIPAPLPEVFADPIQLREIFSELLRNAVKFSASKDSPKITVAATVESDAVRFSVKDNGIGFDGKYADRLFKVFQKLHPPSEYPGNGIGLAIVKRLVQAHGGCVETRAVPNEGAEFTFTLPRPPASSR